MCVQLVKLSVNLLFEHLLFDITAFIDKLLFTFNLSSKNVELSVLFSESIVLHFEFLIKTSLDFCLALSFTLSFESLKSFEHMLAHLLRGFLHVVKFLFVLTFFSSKQTCKLCFALFKISYVTTSNLVDTVFHNTLVDHIVGLVLPLGS